MKEGTIKQQCVCPNTYQDQKYGAQIRVMNSTRKEENKRQQFRCTVCGRMHTERN